MDDIAKIRTKRLVAQGKITPADYMDKADGISSSLRLFLYFLFSFVVAIFSYKFIPELKGNLIVPFINPSIWHPYLPNWAFIAFITFVSGRANLLQGVVHLMIFAAYLFFMFFPHLHFDSLLA